jgi:hypothetical protein
LTVIPISPELERVTVMDVETAAPGNRFLRVRAQLSE